MDELSDVTYDDVEQLAERFMADYRAGRSPNLEQYAAQYPHLAGELRELLMALLLLEQNVPHRGGVEGAATVRSRSDNPPVEIGEFTIVREIGRGGMGVVYEAVQQSLGRHVALKVLSTPSVLHPTHLDRFLLESRAAARLHHSNIVPVFGVGESNGLHYYAMQFIQGQTLEMVIDALRMIRQHGRDAADRRPTAQFSQILASRVWSGGFAADEPCVAEADVTADYAPIVAPAAPTPPTSQGSVNHSEFTGSQGGREFYRSVARIGLQVAEALAYAHGAGILHRDIKPSNLLLDARGNTWVTDFGLARDESSEGLTQSGDFVGTLRYMAPERLEGWSDRRSDVYGLGATLYEMLSLRPFLEIGGRSQLIERIFHEPLPPLSKTDQAVPRDLETIILKAVDKEPASRYRTADEMAEDLRRYLADRSILARRSTPTENLARWCRRNPVVAALTGVAASLLVATVVVLSVSNSRIREESAEKELALQEKSIAVVEKDGALRLQAEALRQQQIATQERSEALALAEKSELLASRRFYAAQMNLASTAWANSDQPRTVELLETLRPGFDEPDLRGFEWYHLYNASHEGVIGSWRSMDSAILDLAWSPNGEWFATEGEGAICLWEGATGKLLGSIPTDGSCFWDFDVSADGNTLVGGEGSGWIFVWDIPSRREVRRWLAHDVSNGVRAVAISPDGRMVVSGAAQTIVSKSGAAHDRVLLEVWDIDGRRLHTLAGHEICVGALAFSPDGNWLATASMDWNVGKVRDVLLWRIEGEQFIQSARITDVGAFSLRFTPDSQTLWARGKTLEEIDVNSATIRRNSNHATTSLDLRQHAKSSNLSPPIVQNRLVTVRNGDTGETEVVGAEGTRSMCVDASPSGRFIASGGNDGWVTLRDLEAPPAIVQEPSTNAAGGNPHINDIAYSDDGQELWVLRDPFSILDADSLQVVRSGPRGAFIAALPAKKLLAEEFSGGVRVWNTETNTVVATLASANSVHCASFSYDGKYLATGYGWGLLRAYCDIWDLETGKLHAQFPTGQFQVISVAFAPHSLQLSVGIRFERVLVYDIGTGSIIDRKSTAPPIVYVHGVAYSRDGTLFAAGAGDGSLVLYDVDSLSGRLEYRAHLRGHSEDVYALAFSPDGTTLASASGDGSVRLWDVALAQERCSFIQNARGLAFSADGKQLAIVGDDKRLTVLRASDAPAARTRRLWHGGTDPDCAERFYINAHDAWNRGDLEKAESLFRQAVRQTEAASATLPLGLDVAPMIRCYDRLSMLLEDAGRQEEAITERAIAIELAVKYKQTHPRSATAHKLWLDLVAEADRVEIDKRAAEERWEDAVAVAQRAVLEHPSDMPSWHSLALIQLKRGDVGGYQSTCARIEQQLREDSSTPQGNALWTIVIAPNAVDDYKSVLQRVRPQRDMPGSTADSERFAALLYRAGEYDEAISRLEKVLEQFAHKPDPESTDLYSWLFLAMAKCRTGDLDEARAIWRDLQSEIEQQLEAGAAWHRRLTLQLLNQEAAVMLGMQLSETTGRAGTAVESNDALAKRRSELAAAESQLWLGQSIESLPGDHQRWFNRAKNFQEKGKWELAAADYQKAADFLHDDSSWWAPRKRMLLDLVSDRAAFPHLKQYFEKKPAFWVAEGQYQALRSNWMAASDAYGKATEEFAPADDPMFEYAGCLLLAGSREAYAGVCKRLLLYCRRTRNAYELFNAARSCALSPDAGVDNELVLDFALESLAVSDTPWGQHVAGLAHYRAGNLDEAIEYSIQSADSEWGDEGKALDDFVLAMAYHKKGQPDLARKSLERGARRMKMRMPTKPADGASAAVPDWIEGAVLKAEASSLIEQK